ncbi:MAG: COX15/CtaA family protein, partial [Rhodocyclaceae bacterium]
MPADAARLKKIRAAALLLSLLSLLVVVVSAYLRLDGAGLGCTDWPACYGRLLGSEPQPPAFGIARLLHRLVATCALLLAGFLIWQCRRPFPIQPTARYATMLLVLMLLLSALGIWSADQRIALVGFLNIVGGFGLVTLSWRVVLATGPALSRAVAQGVLLRFGLAALSVTVLLGAWIGASYAAVSCASLPNCAGLWWPSVDGWAAFNPLLRLTGAALPGDAGGAALNLLHRYGAVVTLLLLGAAG